MLRFLDDTNPNWERFPLEVVNEIIWSFGPRPVFPVHLEIRLEGRIRLVNSTAANHHFWRRGHGWTTVETFYLDRHGIHLQYPHLPLVQIGNNSGSLFPIELIEF